MKTIQSFVLAFILLGPAWAAKPADNPPGAGAETTVSAAAHYVVRRRAKPIFPFKFIPTKRSTKRFTNAACDKEW